MNDDPDDDVNVLVKQSEAGVLSLDASLVYSFNGFTSEKQYFFFFLCKVRELDSQ